MQIIPVLDLKMGQVVRAEGGKRDSYRPIVTPLSDTSEPLGVAKGLLRLHRFRTFYVADLDAIEGRGDNLDVISQLRGLVGRVWVDAGVEDEATLVKLLAEDHVRVVIGSESQADAALLLRFRDDPRIVLSLDFFADGYRGPREMLEKPDLWPGEVIVMTLAKIGGSSGPDFEKLEEIIRLAPDRKIYAAGGVRSEDHLNRLEEMGVDGVLMSSALHGNSLKSEIFSQYD
ncbi:nickel transporter [Nitratireductor aestuarii]|uniref:Nickel transporter n=1 Tax=Nitratireductor aestuarii TaxID=1735103 RepID=A0A916W0Z0_9HYPH|nr:HisA/HisF-related TIM barrel protein [Nitratireductor aestuarii]GGA58854.1 nickel transporter [Nitratireductor aestuarii]